MARYYKYLCPNCGYEVWANPRGYDVLRSGLHIDFLCKNCQEIVSISPSGMSLKDVTLYDQKALLAINFLQR